MFWSGFGRFAEAPAQKRSQSIYVYIYIYIYIWFGAWGLTLKEERRT